MNDTTGLDVAEGRRLLAAAAVARLRSTHWDGNGCGTHGTNACSRCYGPSPAAADEVAHEVLEAVLPLIVPTCPTCQGRNRSTTDMVCMTCGRDYMPDDGSDETGPGLGWLRLMRAWRDVAKQTGVERDRLAEAVEKVRAENKALRAGCWRRTHTGLMPCAAVLPPVDGDGDAR